jgi:monoamine oxidase
MKTSASTPVDVLIVGAGASGLAAWNRLNAFGLSTEVLEAGAAIGGRIRSDRGIELGAEFVHGSPKRLDPFILDAGATLSPYEQSQPAVRLYLHDGVARRDQVLDREVELVHSFEMLNGLAPPSASVRDYVSALDVSPMAKFFALDRFERTSGAPTADLSLWRTVSAFRLDRRGSDNNRISLPYGSVTAALAEGLNPKLKTSVKAIRREGQTLQVVTQGGRTFACRRLLLTCSVAALSGIEFELPKSQILERYRHQRMGHANKVLARFTSSWWGELDYIHTTGLIRTWWRGPRGTNSLVGFSGGRTAQTLARNMRTATRRSVAELDAAFGGVPTRELVEIQFANWTRSPHIRGAYSYSTTLATSEERIDDGPIAKNIFVAGEASAREYRVATVDGAIDSGWRAAAQIADSLRS